MVQVDVFWSYGIGSAFGLAAFRQLRKLKTGRDGEKWKVEWQDEADPIRALEELGRRGQETCMMSKREALKLRRLLRNLQEKYEPAFHNEFFLKNLLFLSMVFVPSGANLLWSNPSWETMQVGKYETIPGWLVSVFSITNISQGILGFLATYDALMKGKYYRAALHTVLAHLGFFFILINGWDKTGYQRFFSRDREAFENWRWSNLPGFANSDVMRILLSYSVVFMPLMFGWMSKWLQDGYDLEEGLERPEDKYERYLETATLSADLLTAVFGVTLGSAVAAHLFIRWFGWVAGGAVAAGTIYAGVLSRRGIVPRLVKRIMKLEELQGPPVQEASNEIFATEELIKVLAGESV